MEWIALENSCFQARNPVSNNLFQLGTKRIYMDIWDMITNWQLVLPPSRPSLPQLNRIVEVTRNLDRSLPVGVLGSTPEFRDLLYECGFKEILIFERNISFYEAMSKSRVYQNPETIIEGDWLNTLPLYKNSLGLVLSDFTSGNLTYELRPKFYSSIENALVDGGLFCDKVLTHTGTNLDLNILIKKYSSMPLDILYVNFFICEALYLSELLDINQVLDTSLFYSLLEEKSKNQRINAFIDQAKKIIPPGGIWYYGVKWENLLPDYCPNLRPMIVDDDESWSPYYRWAKHFIHKKV